MSKYRHNTLKYVVPNYMDTYGRPKHDTYGRNTPAPEETIEETANKYLEQL